MTTTTHTRPTADELKKHLDESLASLRTLRDEIRLDLHLAGMDLRERYEKELEPRLLDAENLAKQANSSSKKAMSEIVTAFRDFQKKLRKIARDMKS